MTAPVAVDTSVAVALLLRTHPHHAEIMTWRSGRPLRLGGHAVAETYSVLTRVPRDIRLAAGDAVRAMDRAFGAFFALPASTSRRLPRLLSDLDVAGGAVYDALVALAAREAGLVLATRDARALDTYRRVGAEVEVVVSRPV